MSLNLAKCENELKLLTTKNLKTRRKFLKSARKCLIKAVSEISLNCLLGNIDMKECQRKKLKAHHKILRKLATKSKSFNKKRKILIQEGGSFFRYSSH